MKKTYTVSIEVEADSSEQAIEDITAFCKVKTSQGVEVNTSKLVKFTFKEENLKKAKQLWLAAFYTRAAETGREMQLLCQHSNKWGKHDYGPSMISEPEQWRLKPEEE